jgi:hypothetical protein
MPHDCHVAGTEALAQAGLVLFERNVEDPMQAVLDAPVAAHSLGSARRIKRGGGDIIARFAVRLAGSFDLGLDLDQAGYAGQAEFAREATIARQPVDLADDADLAPLDTTMAFVVLDVAGADYLLAVMAVAIVALVAIASIETSAPRKPSCSPNRASKAGMAVNSLALSGTAS